MLKKTLQEMNLLDDYLFGTMVDDPRIGERFAKTLLRIILGKEIPVLKVIPQKTYAGADTNYRGIRLDVYLEEEGDSVTNSTIYDVEPDNNFSCRKQLPKRVRFYHAMIDQKSLASGEDYRNLKNVFVIMILSYDPFGFDRMVYTIRSKCEEMPQMPYDDGARTLFLYTRGTEGNPPKELGQFLHYMEKTVAENAVNENLREIQRMVELVKTDKEVLVNYMKIFEREQMLVEEGIGQGENRKLKELIQKKLEKGKSVEEIADALEESTERIRELMEELSVAEKI